MELSDAKPLFETGSLETETGMETVGSSRSRFALAALLIAAVVAPSFLAARAVLKRRSSVPAEVVSAEESALTLLRRDDRPSRKQAIADVESLAKRYPSLIGPAAARLLALSLELDDVRVALKRLQGQSDELKRSVSRPQDQRLTVEAESQIAAAQSQLAAVNKEMEPLLEEAKALDQRVAAAYSGLSTLAAGRGGGDDADAIRAEAVYQGVKGSEKAEALARRYREMGAKDGWDAVALAEYAINAAAPAAVIAEARAQSERSRSTDSAFLRPYVLAARLALLQRDYDAASTLLDAVVALNPSHQMARQLTGWVEEAKRSEAAKAAPAMGDPSGQRR